MPVVKKSTKTCKETVVKGGRFEWRCIRQEHKSDRPDSHVFEVVREIAQETTI